MSIIQIIISFFVLFVILKLIKRLRAGELSWPLFFLWSIFWIGVAIITWRTEILDSIAKIVGVGRGADLVIYCSLLILFYLMFRIFVRLDKIEKRITEIVRSRAKDEFWKKDYDKSRDNFDKL